MGRQHVVPGKKAKLRRQQTAADLLEKQFERMKTDLTIGPKIKGKNNEEDRNALRTYVSCKVAEARVLQAAGCTLGPATLNWIKEMDKFIQQAKKKAQVAAEERKKRIHDELEEERREERKRGR